MEVGKILSLFATIFLSQSAAPLRHINSAYFTRDTDEGIRLDRHSFLTIETSSIFNCAMFCLRKHQCVSWNFSRQRRICQLNNETARDFPNDVTLEDGSWYFELTNKNGKTSNRVWEMTKTLNDSTTELLSEKITIETSIQTALNPSTSLDATNGTTPPHTITRLITSRLSAVPTAKEPSTNTVNNEPSTVDESAAPSSSGSPTVSMSPVATTDRPTIVGTTMGTTLHPATGKSTTPLTTAATNQITPSRSATEESTTRRLTTMRTTTDVTTTSETTTHPITMETTADDTTMAGATTRQTTTIKTTTDVTARTKTTTRPTTVETTTDVTTTTETTTRPTTLETTTDVTTTTETTTRLTTIGTTTDATTTTETTTGPTTTGTTTDVTTTTETTTRPTTIETTTDATTTTETTTRPTTIETTTDVTTTTESTTTMTTSTQDPSTEGALVLPYVVRGTCYLHFIYATSLPENGIRYIENDFGMFPVYCEQLSQSGGWTVIQRRVDDTVSFERGWQEYKDGFGDLETNFWLGLDKIASLCPSRNCEVIFLATDATEQQREAWYNGFGVEGPEYSVYLAGYATGDAGDSMAVSQLTPFSTFDEDHDSSSVNCASDRRGGWWYTNCGLSSPNGIYYYPGDHTHSDGILWGSWNGLSSSMKRMEIRVRDRNAF